MNLPSCRCVSGPPNLPGMPFDRLSERFRSQVELGAEAGRAPQACFDSSAVIRVYGYLLRGPSLRDVCHGNRDAADHWQVEAVCKIQKRNRGTEHNDRQAHTERRIGKFRSLGILCEFVLDPAKNQERRSNAAKKEDECRNTAFAGHLREGIVSLKPETPVSRSFDGTEVSRTDAEDWVMYGIRDAVFKRAIECPRTRWRPPTKSCCSRKTKRFAESHPAA